MVFSALIQLHGPSMLIPESIAGSQLTRCSLTAIIGCGSAHGDWACNGWIIPTIANIQYCIPSIVARGALIPFIKL